VEHDERRSLADVLDEQPHLVVQLDVHPYEPTPPAGDSPL
jgi:hypothetical protein